MLYNEEIELDEDFEGVDDSGAEVVTEFDEIDENTDYDNNHTYTDIDFLQDTPELIDTPTPVVDPVVEDEDPIPDPEYETISETYEIIIQEYSQEYLQELEDSGYTFYVVYEDGTEDEVDISEIEEPTTNIEFLDDEAYVIANSILEHFWDDNSGVHVTQDSKEAWAQLVEDNFPDLDATHPHHNIIVNSYGVLIRSALKNLVQLSRSALAFYDGQGNNSSNIISVFGRGGIQIGPSDQKHLVINNNGITVYNGDGTVAPLTASNIQAIEANIQTLTAADVSITNRLTAAEGDIDTLETNTADIGTIRANSAKVTNLTAAQLEAANAYIAALTAGSVTASDIIADTGKIHSLTAEQLSAATAYIAALTAGSVTAADILADHAVVDDLDANYAHITNGIIDNAKIGHADVNGLSANYAQVNMANVNNAWIQNGTVKDGAITNAMINSVSANKLTAGTIDASNITVTNLNADNITAGTLNGQRIGEGTLSLDKLEEDVYTETEVDGIVQNLQTQIDGAIETWTGTTIPTLQNAPASSWNTNALKDSHVGDVYFVVNSQSQQNGYNYRFTKSGSTYSWQLIKDTDITNALQRISTAEGKITTFDSDISQLKTDTGTLTTKTTSLETRMSDAENDILDKVDTTTFNSVSDTVDQHTQTISQHTTAISNKADSSTVTAVTSRVSKNEQDITGINTTIGELQNTVETKADGSTVETVSNRLNTVSNTVDGHTQSLQSITQTQTTIQKSAVKSTVQLWFTKADTTAPAKPTAHVTTNNAATGNAWNLAVPTYNSAYPNYYYCYEYQYVDDSYGWSAVTRDIATGEMQATARQAQEDINNLEIGGRNLLRGKSDATVTNNGITVSYNASTHQYRVYGTNTKTDSDWSIGPYFYSDTDDYLNLVAGDEVTFSTDVVVPSSGAYIQLNLINASNAQYQAFRFVFNGFKRSTTVTLPSTQSSSNHSGTGFIGILSTCRSIDITFRLKLEKGNKATDWTPAPEDVDADISTAQTSADNAQATANKNIKESQQLWFTKANSTAPNKPTVKVTSTSTGGNAWTTKVPTYNENYKHYFYCMQYIAADGTVTWSDVIYDQATTEAQSVARTTSANLTTLQQDYATFKQTTQQFESTIGTTYATKTEFENLEIGGRNLLRHTAHPEPKGLNSAAIYDTDGWYTWANPSVAERTDDGIKVTFNTNRNGFVIPFVNDDIVLGETDYILSFDARGTFAGPTIVYALARSGANWTTSDTSTLSLSETEWTKVEIPVKWPSFGDRKARAILFPYSNASGKWIEIRDGSTKLEKGNKATDWSPAPEDVDADISAIESRVTTAETTIDQHSEQIALRATKTEATQMAQPNLSPFFSMAPTNVYNATTNPDGYWDDSKATGTGTNKVEQLADGWAHLSFSNIESSTRYLTIYEHSAWRHKAGDLKGSTKYTVMFEFRNVTKTGSVTCLGMTQSLTSWPSMFIRNSEQGNVAVADGVQYHVGTTVADPASVTGSTCSTRTLIDFPAGSSLDAEFRVSLYEGEYAGPYKPYSGDMMYATNSELKVAADGISTEVGKKVGSSEIISRINQSPETVKIQASKVEIDGAAIFANSAFKAAADAAYDAKGSAANVQTNLDNLEIGGRNLLRGTGSYALWDPSHSNVTPNLTTTDEWIKFTTPENKSWWTVEPHDAFIPIEDWDISSKYTLSVDIKYDNRKTNVQFPRIGVETVTNKNVGYGSRVNECTIIGVNPSTNNWTHFERTFNGDYSTWTSANSGTPAYVKVVVWLYIDSSEVDAVYIRRLKLEKGNKATDWTPAPEDIDSSIDDVYDKIRSQGIQLVTNGNGFMGDNTNWSGLRFDGAKANGSPGSFTKSVSYTTIYTDEMFPIDPSKQYLFEFDAMSSDGTGHLYSFLSTYDTDKNEISAYNVMYHQNTLTTLASDLNPGDMTVKLTNAANFVTTTATHQRTLIFWDYTNANGYTYPAETYSRNVYPNIYADDSKVDKSTGVITLKSAWTGPKKTAGTQVSQGHSGSTFAYSHVNIVIPATWTHYSALISGIDTSKNGSDDQDKFRQGSAFAKVGFLWNYNNSNQGQIWVTNVSVKEASASLSNTVSRTQRIWYRKSTVGAPATPGAASSNWVTKSDDGSNAWTKMHVSITTSEKYIYTCEQYEMADGKVGYTSVLLDNTITVIDGGSIITNSVTAEQIAAGAITTDKLDTDNLLISTGNIEDLDDDLSGIQERISSVSLDLYGGVTDDGDEVQSVYSIINDVSDTMASAMKDADDDVIDHVIQSIQEDLTEYVTKEKHQIDIKALDDDVQSSSSLLNIISTDLYGVEATEGSDKIDPIFVTSTVLDDREEQIDVKIDNKARDTLNEVDKSYASTKTEFNELKGYIVGYVDETTQVPMLVLGQRSGAVQAVLTNSVLDFITSTDVVPVASIGIENGNGILKVTRANIGELNIGDNASGHWQWQQRQNGNLALKFISENQ